MSSHELEFLLTKIYILKKNRPTSGERLNRSYTKFDFAVDEGKERLIPSRERNSGKHRRRGVGKSCVTPAGTSTNITSIINGMTTHTHTPFVAFDQRFS